MLVTHTYNSSYSGGRDQEDRGSKPARQIDLVSKKKKITKNRLAEWLKE
jgi:hypothetical protein